MNQVHLKMLTRTTAAIFVLCWLIWHNSETAAAWVQAAGTIAAIFGAVWTAMFQQQESHRREGRNALLQRLVLFETATTLAEAIIRALERLDCYVNTEGKPFQSKAETGSELRNIESLIERLHNIPLYKLEDANAVDDIVRMEAIAMDITANAPGVEGVSMSHLPFVNTKTELRNRALNLERIADEIRQKHATIL